MPTERIHSQPQTAWGLFKHTDLCEKYLRSTTADLLFMVVLGGLALRLEIGVFSLNLLPSLSLLLVRMADSRRDLCFGSRTGLGLV